MSITKRARYGELFLHYVHRRGYPLEEERKAFNRRFYDLDDDYRKNSRTPISDFHRSLKVSSLSFLFFILCLEWCCAGLGKEQPRAAQNLHHSGQ